MLIGWCQGRPGIFCFPSSINVDTKKPFGVLVRGPNSGRRLTTAIIPHGTTVGSAGGRCRRAAHIPKGTLGYPPVNAVYTKYPCATPPCGDVVPIFASATAKGQDCDRRMRGVVLAAGIMSRQGICYAAGSLTSECRCGSVRGDRLEGCLPLAFGLKRQLLFAERSRPDPLCHLSSLLPRGIHENEVSKAKLKTGKQNADDWLGSA